MTNVIYEKGTTFGDAGILYLTKNQPCVIPFKFEIPTIDNNDNIENYEILPTDVVRFTFKSDIKLITPSLVKSYNQISNNIAVLRLSPDDMHNFLGGKTYYLSAILYNAAGNKLKTLIKKLQIKIQEVV